MEAIEMKNIWKAFVKGEKIEEEKIKPEILNSWRRCLGKIIPFQKKNQSMLGSNDFNKLCDENKELIEVSTPVMQELYEFVRGSGFVIALSETSGYLLKVIGDEDVINIVKEINFIVGASWSEGVMGTNALGTCIVADKPIQIFGSEHWCTCVRVGVCSAAPIHDPDSGQILGALDMTAADNKKVNPHTLGMVVAAVSSIEGQMSAKRNWMRSRNADQYKTLIMESISEGLLTIDNAGVITHINQKAINFLSLYGNLLGENIFNILKKRFGSQENYRDLLSILNSREKADGEFVNIFNDLGVIKCTITSRCLLENDKIGGKIITIQEISKIKKIVNRVAGNRAQTFFSDIIGRNKNFLECVEVAKRVSKSSSNVLLMGDSGTGKDLFAQAIHNNSSRVNEPYIAINCAAIPRDLLGSELFGFTGGVFTGAKKGGNPGKFELADNGTIFLDEIGEMPLDMQISLLRAIEEKAITRIGGHGAIPVNVRIIAATNKDLAKEVSLGNFRSDLYYRLNVITIQLPSLKERKEDIPLLAEHLAKKIALTMKKDIQQIESEFINKCMNYNWPGNVRELQNIIEKAINLTNEPVLSTRTLPLNIFPDFNSADVTRDKHGKRNLEEAKIKTENELIRISLVKSGGNKRLAAKELGIARSSLYRKLKKLTIEL